MNFNKFLTDMFVRQGEEGQQQTNQGPSSAGMARIQNDPVANQSKFEEVKAKQGGATAPGIAG